MDIDKELELLRGEKRVLELKIDQAEQDLVNSNNFLLDLEKKKEMLDMKMRRLMGMQSAHTSH